MDFVKKMEGALLQLILVLASSVAAHESRMTMPGAKPAYADSYLCTAFSTKSLLKTNQAGVTYLTGFRPEANAMVAHHMLLHYCSEPSGAEGEVFDCLSGGVCKDQSHIIFGWAKNAQSMKMPDQVSMHINTNEIKYFVLQVHYAKQLDEPDTSTSLVVETLSEKTRYDASMLLLYRMWMSIPPNTPMYHGDMNCKITNPNGFRPFAFRTHSHAFGTVTTGYKYSPKTGQMTEFARGNPQWPQAFYPVTNNITFEEGDYIIGRCSYNTTGVNREVHVAATHDQEMCNLYVMYYLDNGASAMNIDCPNEQNPGITQLLPADSDQPLPPNPELELRAKAGHASGSNSEKHKTVGKKVLNPVDEEPGLQNVTLTIPGALPTKTDSYLCTSFDARTWGKSGRLPLYIKKFSVDSTAEKVHHLIVKACVTPNGQPGEIWDCMHHSECQGPSKIMYAWAKDAPPADIPNEVGFQIDDEMPYLTMQVHYKNPLTEKDYAGVNLKYTTKQPKYFGGIYLLLDNNAVLPPQQPKIDIDVNCQVNGLESPLTVFAFRTHAHKHGTHIAGYRVDPGDATRDGEITEIAQGNPQLPQAFYPTKEPQDIHNGDWVAARCSFSTMEENREVRIGPTAGDEMCNLYLMFYTKSQNQHQTFQVCVGQESKSISQSLPKTFDPSNVKKKVNKGELPIDYQNGHSQADQGRPMEPKKKKQFSGFSDSDGGGGPQETFYQVNNWPVPETMARVGQPSGVAIDIYGNPTIFHRGDRVWDSYSFNWKNEYAKDKSAAIPNDTILTLNSAGQVINAWGRDFFFLPHMITIDSQNNFWMTDVALHQVFKFGPYGGKTKQPLVTLGQRFEPGTDDVHYCKPTSVAVAKDGKTFYVADGYCNSRIIQYGLEIDSTGYHKVTKLTSWGEPNSHNIFPSKSPYSLNIPHGLALSESLGMICVADRENGRVQCYSTSDAQFKKTVQLKEFSSTIYGIDISEKDGMLFAVSGPEDLTGKRAQGYQIDLDRVELVDVWNSGGAGLVRPHDVAVSANGTEVYVVDLQPFNVIKLVYGSSVITNTIPANSPVPSNPMGSIGSKDISTSPKEVLDHLQTMLPNSNLGVTVAIVSLSITVLCSICIACKKCRKRGKGKTVAATKKKDRNALDLGDLLGRSKDGFQPLNTDDAEVLSSDSEDLEDFNVPSSLQA